MVMNRLLLACAAATLSGCSTFSNPNVSGEWTCKAIGSGGCTTIAENDQMAWGVMEVEPQNGQIIEDVEVRRPHYYEIARQPDRLQIYIVEQGEPAEHTKETTRLIITSTEFIELSGD